VRGGTSKSLDTGATGLHKPEIHYGYIKIIKAYAGEETRSRAASGCSLPRYGEVAGFSGLQFNFKS
jgi:hypothetical protein